MFNTKKILKNNEGFSLVEMIVVIAIMVILVTTIISKTVGYIKKAEEISAMNTLKVMVDAMEVGLVEHGLNGEVRADKSYKRLGDEQFTTCGAITNWMLWSAQNQGKFSEHDAYDVTIVYEMLEAVRCEKGQKNPRMSFAQSPKPFGYQAAAYKKKTSGKDGALFIYSPGGGVFAAQVTMGNYFVTYRDGNYSVKSINDPTAKFFDKDTVNRNGQRW